MYRLAAFMMAGAAILAGFAVYAEPPANPGDDPPILLKKKGAPEIDDPAPPAEKDKDKDSDKKPADAPKPDADKGEPEKPQVDADEVLSRVAKNMRRIEERLANKEVGDGTRQAEDDVLKDLDSLIDLSENPPQSQDDKSDSSKSSDSSSSKSDSSKSSSDSSKSSSDSSKSSSDSSKSSSDSSKSSASKSGSSSSSSAGKTGKSRGKGSRSSKGKSGSQPGASGSQPGNGSASSGEKKQGDQPQDGVNNGNLTNQGDKHGPNDPQKDPNADLYKNVWGHLPETLRAEMNAYSSTKGFMPEYEALISKYYSNIAEQGRRKGD